MGNTIGVDSDPPELSAFCGEIEEEAPTVTPVSTKAVLTLNLLGDKHDCRSYLLGWRFLPGSGSDGAVRHSPIKFTEIKEFSPLECYILLHTYQYATTSANIRVPPDPTSHYKPPLNEFLSSSKGLFRTGRAYPLSSLTGTGTLATKKEKPDSASGSLVSKLRLTLPTDTLKGTGAKPKGLEIDIYLWSGMRASPLTRSMALAKAFELERSLQSTKLSAVKHFFLKNSQVPISHILDLSACTLPTLDVPAVKTKYGNYLIDHLLANCLKFSTSLSDFFEKYDVTTVSSPTRFAERDCSDMLKIVEKLKSSLTVSMSFAVDEQASGAAKTVVTGPNASDMAAANQALNYHEGFQVSELDAKKKKLDYFDTIASKITDNIYLGSETVSRNRKLLKQLNITHILNCAGTACPNSYPTEFDYKTLYLADGKGVDIQCVFYSVMDFINEAVDNGGKIFIHCHQGVSRSSALLIAYLMWKRDEPFTVIHPYVKSIRGTSNPNTGFTCQLLEWHNRRHKPMEKPMFYMIVPHCVADADFLVPKQIREVSASSLDPRGAFILHTPSVVFIWAGRKCPPYLVDAAATEVARLQRYENATTNVVKVAQGEETPEFWEVIGGEGPVSEVASYDQPYSLLKPADSRKAAAMAPETSMFRYPDWEEMEMFDSDDLEDNMAFVCCLKNAHEASDKLYVWLGEEFIAQEAKDEDGKDITPEALGVRIGELFLKEKNLSPMKMLVVRQDHEEDDFWDFFSNTNA
eukprot:CAMPEP_0177639568 /NCGR_PEP_ID=MMETSP0447-20121125/6090_1 /TAXON_ID=0 /ORGANISM="Stygamoeba regulata, Strain BSH-02190019" /LENGTH=747 /DNA_ID=CAMNT_0019141603 /DNA_START=122 /DNA_END=2365 /DNA_ORIENTATION=-